MSDNQNQMYEDDFEDEGEVEPETEESLLRKRLISVLKIYPRVSPSMMQAAVGPHNSPSRWRPILEDLIREGVVERKQEAHCSERGRWRTVIIISLTAEALACIDAEDEIGAPAHHSV